MTSSYLRFSTENINNQEEFNHFFDYVLQLRTNSENYADGLYSSGCIIRDFLLTVILRYSPKIIFEYLDNYVINKFDDRVITDYENLEVLMIALKYFIDDNYYEYEVLRVLKLLFENVKIDKLVEALGFFDIDIHSSRFDMLDIDEMVQVFRYK